MAITSNIDLINTYDGNFQVVSTAALSRDDPPEMEHAAQCVAMEALRSLVASGMTPQEYNDMSDDAWRALIAEAVTRAKLNVNAPVSRLDFLQQAAGANIGGNYFERGYLNVMADIQPADKIQFTRIGGL